jgi:hypothetical protein
LNNQVAENYDKILSLQMGKSIANSVMELGVPKASSYKFQKIMLKLSVKTGSKMPCIKVSCFFKPAAVLILYPGLIN